MHRWATNALQRNVIWMAFRWRADGGPLLDVYWDATLKHLHLNAGGLMVARF